MALTMLALFAMAAILWVHQAIAVPAMAWALIARHPLFVFPVARAKYAAMTVAAAVAELVRKLVQIIALPEFALTRPHTRRLLTAVLLIANIATVQAVALTLITAIPAALHIMGPVRCATAAA